MLFSLLDDGRTKPKPREGRKPLPEPSEYMCLMRATLRKKKISTVVSCANRGLWIKTYRNYPYAFVLIPLVQCKNKLIFCMGSISCCYVFEPP